ncbi:MULTISPECIES: C1 family peptidase [unclassified Streptomyces]|uniref:C1 family peptidase n=1 Tax=Streptomyces sp. NPDC055082 TaxID=3365718 RepID=UPI0037CD688F
MPSDSEELADLQRRLREEGAGWQAGPPVRRCAGSGVLPTPEGVPLVPSFEGPVPEPGSYPEAFDWRTGDSHISGVRDQGGCNACVAFGVLAAVEGTFQVEQHNPSPKLSLSPAHLYYCRGERECTGSKSGWGMDAPYEALKKSGVTTEEFFPYTGGNQECSSKKTGWDDHLMGVAGADTTEETATMKSWISTTGPLAAFMQTYMDFGFYESGVYYPTSTESTGYHCLALVGYNDDGGYWIVKNSWGTEWGMEGFGYIKYGVCGLDKKMWRATGVTARPAGTTTVS